MRPETGLSFSLFLSSASLRLVPFSVNSTHQDCAVRTLPTCPRWLPVCWANAGMEVESGPRPFHLTGNGCMLSVTHVRMGKEPPKSMQENSVPSTQGWKLCLTPAATKEALKICGASVKILEKILPQWWGKTNSRQHVALEPPTNLKSKAKKDQKVPRKLNCIQEQSSRILLL